MHRLVVVMQVRNNLLMSQKILPGPRKRSSLSQNSISHSKSLQILTKTKSPLSQKILMGNQKAIHNSHRTAHMYLASVKESVAND